MVITCLKPEDHDKVGSCGRPFTIVEVGVVDDEDRALPAGERGEIVCRGPQTMAYYWNNPEATAEAFRNGWLHTGDVGYMDSDGFFYLVDRKNDLLISGGYNVYPREVEDVLLGYEGVVEAAVVGLADEKWGDRVFAVVSGRAGLSDPEHDARARARADFASYKRPKAIEIWPELPKSSANKILQPRRPRRDRPPRTAAQPSWRVQMRRRRSERDPSRHAWARDQETRERRRTWPAFSVLTPTMQCARRLAKLVAAKRVRPRRN